MISQGSTNDVGLILSANFHRDFNKIKDHDSIVQSIINSINDWENDMNRFNELSNNIFGE